MDATRVCTGEPNAEINAGVALHLKKGCSLIADWIIISFQFWLPGLGSANKTQRPKFKLHYLTYALPSLLPSGTDGGIEGGDADGEFQYPVPLKELPRKLREGAAKSKYAPYGMRDLTVGSWVQLARRVGDGAKARVRDRFVEYMYQGGEAE